MYLYISKHIHVKEKLHHTEHMFWLERFVLNDNRVCLTLPFRCSDPVRIIGSPEATEVLELLRLRSDIVSMAVLYRRLYHGECSGIPFSVPQQDNTFRNHPFIVVDISSQTQRAGSSFL